MSYYQVQLTFKNKTLVLVWLEFKNNSLDFLSIRYTSTNWIKDLLGFLPSLPCSHTFLKGVHSKDAPDLGGKGYIPSDTEHKRYYSIVVYTFTLIQTVVLIYHFLWELSTLLNVASSSLLFFPCGLEVENRLFNLKNTRNTFEEHIDRNN